MKENFIGGYTETESRKIELSEWPALGIIQEIHTQTKHCFPGLHLTYLAKVKEPVTLSVRI